MVSTMLSEESILGSAGKSQNLQYEMITSKVNTSVVIVDLEIGFESDQSIFFIFL